ncbi:MAG: L,D-transpeptidase [Thermodesulfovibrionia bacterium]|nr:L,D-transpeptidase [Thermodesulfovibrionia bacterium]
MHSELIIKKKNSFLFENSMQLTAGIFKKKALIIILLVIFTIFLALEAVGFYLASRGHTTISTRKVIGAKSLHKLRAKNTILKKRISNLSPKETYIVVDTAKNRLYLEKEGQILKEVVVSTGSGGILKDPAGNRQWVFDTPRGELAVQSKTTSPVWTKPDWAFIEEGEDIPKSYKDRVEEGVLGDYALSLGNGYLIHGTLYTRLLGRNVTHGCIRVGDKDLKELYNTIPIGTKVIIF